MIKLDLEKAFGDVNWDFLMNVLKGFGFRENWLTWMKMCIFLAKFSILVNDSSKVFLEQQMDLDRVILYLLYYL